MTVFAWNSGTGGDWGTASDWKGDVQPGTTDTASITTAGTYTITVDSAETIAGVTLNAAGATLQVNSTLTVNGILAVKAGTLDVSADATLANATIEPGAAAVVELGSYTYFDNVTYHGTLSLGTSGQLLEVLGNLTMAGAAGSGDGTILLNASYSQLYFGGGSQTLNSATVDIGSATGSTIGMEYYYENPQQLTFGPKTVIDDTGPIATISTNDSYNTLVNEGTIEAELAGGTLAISGGGTFSNTGSIVIANQAVLLAQVGSFSNSGKITLSGATLNISGTFTDTGSFADTNSALTLSGYLTTATLQTITRSGGTLTIAGTLDNTGTTLDLGTGTKLTTIDLAGTLLDGTVHDLGGGLAILDGAALSGVTYDGAVTLTDDVELTIENGLTLTGLNGTGAGSLDMSGLYDTLDFAGATAQTLDNAAILLGNTGNDAILVNGTMTFGPKLVLTHVGTNAEIAVQSGIFTNEGSIGASFADGSFLITGSTFDNAGQIVVSHGDVLQLTASDVINTGTIAVNTGGTLTLGASNGTVSNTGLVTLNGGEVLLGGASLTLANLAAIKLTSGTLGVSGTLNLAAATMNVGPGSALGTLEVTGTIEHGTIHDAGNGLVFQGSTTAPAGLANVVYEGSLDLAPADSVLEITGSFTDTGLSGSGAGLINLTGAGSELIISGSATLNGATIDIGATPIAGTGSATATLAEATGTSNETLTLGATLQLVQTGESAALDSSYSTGDEIVNRGLISTGFSGGSFVLSEGTFVNDGSIVVANGNTFYAESYAFDNAGVVTVETGGVLVIDGTWNSTGVIGENAGTIDMNAAVTVAQLGQIKHTGGLVVIGGGLNLAGSTLKVGTGSALGSFGVVSAITNGTVRDGGGGLVFGSSGFAATVGDLTYAGTLEVGAAQEGGPAAGTLLVTGGLVLTGANGTGPGALVMNGGSLGTSLYFRGSQTIDNATITMGGTSAIIGISDNYGVASLLTFGPHLTITQTALDADMNSDGYDSYEYYQGDGMVNDGTINAGVHHGYLDVYGPSFTNNGVINVSNGEIVYLETDSFTNTGVIDATTGGVVELELYGSFVDTGKISEVNATVLMYGTLTVPFLSSISRSGGVLDVAGSLDLAGTALAVGTGTTMGSLSVTGYISNGTIQDHGGGIQFYGQYLGSGGSLSDVTYQGLIDLSESYSSLTISNGLVATGAGGTGPGSVLLTGAGSEMTFDNTQTFDNVTITIGNSAVASVLNFSDTYYDGETLTLGPHLLLKAKVGLSEITSSRALGDTILNQGTVLDTTGGARLSMFGGTFDNTGTVSVANSAVMILEPDLLANGAAGIITAASNGDLVLGAASGAGKFDILAGGTMDFSSTAAASVTATFVGANGVLQLEDPGQFAGKIAGFGANETIDLVGLSSTGTTATISGTTLAVKQGTGGVLDLTLASSLTGTAAVASDGNGGTDITFAAAAAAKVAFVNGADGTGTFTGTADEFEGQVLKGFLAGDKIDVTDLSFAGAVLKVVAGASETALQLASGGHSADIVLAASFVASEFHKAADGHGGTMIAYT